MVLPLVIFDDKEKPICTEKIFNGYRNAITEGMFLTDDGKLGIIIGNETYNLRGEKIKANGRMGYECYVEGGIAGIIPNDGKYRTDKFGSERKAHPAYGCITISRTTSGIPCSLFGSSIKHEHFINMTIYHAEKEWENNKEWVHSNGRICQVEMSLSQFSDAITSVGNGDGVPCTILFTEMEGHTPVLDFESKAEKHVSDFKNRLAKKENSIDSTIKSLEKIFGEKKNLTKADKENILSMLKSVKTEFSENSGYAVSCFAEEVDHQLMEAKTEIEAFVQRKVVNGELDKLPESYKDGNVEKLIES